MLAVETEPKGSIIKMIAFWTKYLCIRVCFNRYNGSFNDNRFGVW